MSKGICPKCDEQTIPSSGIGGCDNCGWDQPCVECASLRDTIDEGREIILRLLVFTEHTPDQPCVQLARKWIEDNE